MTAAEETPVFAAPAVAQTGAQRGQAWTAIAVMVVVPALAIAAGQAGALRLVYPLLTVLVSGFLYWRSKPLYVGLVFWLWFFTPFLGRMAEYQGGLTLADPVLVSPYLAAGISVFAMLTNPRRLGERRSVPFICALAAILYGSLIGLPQCPTFDVLRAALNWVVPVFFGYFVLQHRELYPEFRQVIEKSFLYGLLIAGSYGIWQFFYLPEWDRRWMLNAQLSSFGKAEAMQLRVFSTMNAPTIFAAVAACGLLLLFSQKGKLRLLAAAVVFMALILTMSRAGWLSLAVGFVLLATQAEKREIVRLAIAVLACALFFLAFVQIPAINNLVTQRISTFSDPSQDISYTARVAGHEQALSTLSREPFGEGIGSTDAKHSTAGHDSSIGPHDSTVLEFLYSLGWAGTLIYGLGLGFLLAGLRGAGKDPFVLTCKGIVFALFAQCLLNSIMLGILGFLVWTFAALAIVHKETVQEAHELSEMAAEVPAEYLAA